MASSVHTDKSAPTTGLTDDQNTEERRVESREPSVSPEPPSEQPVADSDEPSSTPAEEAQPPVYSVLSQWEKRLIVLGASIAAFFSPVTAQIYLPALNVIASDFQITSSQVNLTVTTYMIFQGITPSLIGGLADTAGRRPAYIICFVIYIVANIGLALCKNYASLLVVRCLQSAGSASTVALCQAVVADIVTSAERGQYIGITVIPIVLAPSLGPVVGGLLSQYLGWRSIFWFLTICAGVVFVLLLLFFPETCRDIVGDGSIRPHPFYRTFYQLIKESHVRRKTKRAAAHDPDGLQRTVSTATSTASHKRLTIKVTNPLASVFLLFQKEIGTLLMYSSLSFSGFYAIATAMPSQLFEIYGFSDVVIGLMYLPMAGGSIVAAFVMGPAINWNYRRHAKKLGMLVDKSRQQDLSKFPIERARLEIAIPLVLLSSVVLIGWGWAMEKRTSVAVPCVLLFLLGISMIGFSNATSILLVDVTPGRAGTAVAANNLTRCLVGAAASAVIVPMINAMGAGWAFTLIGLLFIVFCPVLFLIMHKGISWRKELRDKDERKKAKDKETREDGDDARAGLQDSTTTSVPNNPETDTDAEKAS